MTIQGINSQFGSMMVVHLYFQADLKRSYQDPGPSGLNNGLPYGSNLSLCTLFIKYCSQKQYNVSGRKAQFSSKDEISPGNG